MCEVYLGVLVDQDLNWSQQVSHIRRKSLASLVLVRRVSSFMPTTVLLSLYNAFVLPHLTYCCMVWHFCSNTLSDNLQRVQNFAMRIILKKPARTSSNFCLTLLGWSSLFQRRCIALLWQVHKCFLHLAPAYLCSKFLTNNQFGYSHTRGSENFHLISPKTSFGRNSLTFRGAAFYNSLPRPIRSLHNCISFLKACSEHLYKSAVD